jgi:serine/threonine protein kinase
MADPPINDGCTLASRAVGDAPTLPPGSRIELPRPFGRYRLEKLLGQGGMGAVYLAHDTELGRSVALKIPTLSGCDADNAKARFLREVKAAAVLQHPNVCPIIEVDEFDGTPFMTMAYIPGQTLAKVLHSSGPFAPRAAVEMTRKLALALDSAHARGVIHRDLKPGNIQIDERGEPVVMDFGLARRADLVGEQLTRPGEVLGTPSYMPPEQMTGDVELMGPLCDVYSLGVILYELLTGEVPFSGDLLALMSQVTLDAPAPPSSRRAGLDPRLDAICLKALAKAPADRFPSMRAFADALSGWLNAGGPALMLRVVGTPFAYRPLPNQTIISVGRQRRKPGDPDDVGNDMILRVPGDDAQSTRISRRHFEIQRDGDTYSVVDSSKAGTQLNGMPLPRGTPTPLASGDRLTVADVVELEVVLETSSASARLARPEVRLRDGGFVLEATLGDMITEE